MDIQTLKDKLKMHNILEYLKKEIRGCFGSGDDAFEKLTFLVSFSVSGFVFVKFICEYCVSCLRTWGQLSDTQVTSKKKISILIFHIYLAMKVDILASPEKSENHSGHLTNVY